MILDSKDQQGLLLSLITGTTMTGNKAALKKNIVTMDNLEVAVTKAEIAVEKTSKEPDEKKIVPLKS